MCDNYEKKGGREGDTYRRMYTSMAFFLTVASESVNIAVSRSTPAVIVAERARASLSLAFNKVARSSSLRVEKGGVRKASKA